MGFLFSCMIHIYTDQLPRSERESIRCRIQQAKTPVTLHLQTAFQLCNNSFLIQYLCPTKGAQNLYFFDTMPDSFPPRGINSEVFSNSGNTTLQNSLIFTFAPQTHQKSKYSSHFRGMGLYYFPVRGQKPSSIWHRRSIPDVWKNICSRTIASSPAFSVSRSRSKRSTGAAIISMPIARPIWNLFSSAREFPERKPGVADNQNL